MADEKLEAPAEEMDELEGEDEADEGQSISRTEELSKRAGIKSQLNDLYRDVEQGFQDQYERSNEQMDYWDIYNCALNENQFYSGTSRIYVPIVHNAVDARKTRFTNQIFPVSGRYVECTTETGDIPHEEIALAEYYIRKAKLRTKVMPALVKNGDVEGQYNLYVSWREVKRNVARKVKKPVEVDGLQIPGEDMDDIEESTVTTGHPFVEVLADSDVLVLPQTCDDIDEVLEIGGSVSILRRWTKSKIKKMARIGEITKSGADSLVAAMTEAMANADSRTNKSKEATDAAGIRERGKYALVYESWSKLTVKGEQVICRSYFGGEDQILGCKRNPYWCDRLPLFSVPVEKIQGSFKGISKVEPCATLQYQANDAVNEAMDSAAYALMPIVMTDPAKNPRVGSMILSMAAIWETSPQDTQFAEFPPLWKDGMEIVAAAKAQIFETLSVNSSMMPNMTRSLHTKLNQAEVALEQQVELVSTADAVVTIEEGVLTPMINFFIELDHQYRDEAIMVKQYGDVGAKAAMHEIPPLQMDRRYAFRWSGVEAARNAQQIQQQIASINVIRGIPPDQYNGYKLNLVPVISQLVENSFGPRLAPLVWISPEEQLPVPAEQENMFLAEGFEVPTHDMDDDQQHIQAHMAGMQQAQGANAKKFQTHIFKHVQQAARKQQAAMAMQQGQPGVPGGAGPGVAGTPRPGAQPAAQRPAQGPPGMIHQDQMKDPSAMPRKM